MLSPQFYVCANCSTRHLLNNSTKVYRCGDAYVCSTLCAEIRLEKIMGIDPLLKEPTIWDLELDTECENINYNNDSSISSKKELIDTQPTNIKMSTNDILKAKQKENDYGKNIDTESKTKTKFKKIHIEREREISERCNRCLNRSALCLFCLFIVVSILNYTH